MSLAEDLGNLILRLNPYTENKDTTQGPLTGKMDVYMSNPKPGGNDGVIDQIRLEVDTRYPGMWSFKGQEQRVNTAVRIPYRYPILDADGNAKFWVEDYLLLGFEGSGA